MLTELVLKTGIGCRRIRREQALGHWSWARGQMHQVAGEPACVRRAWPAPGGRRDESRGEAPSGFGACADPLAGDTPTSLLLG